MKYNGRTEAKIKNGSITAEQAETGYSPVAHWENWKGLYKSVSTVHLNNTNES